MTKIQRQKNENQALPIGYIAEEDIATMLGKKKESLRSAHSRGTLSLPKIKVGKLNMYREKAFFEWLRGLEEVSKRCHANDNKKVGKDKTTPTFKKKQIYKQIEETKKENNKPFFSSSKHKIPSTDVKINPKTNTGEKYA